MDESSSEASLHSTHNAAAACVQNTKGGHIAALRSLGLLHELQEYVAAAVETTQQQERELWKLKAEKKEVERALKQKALRSPEAKQPCLQQFQASEICDLPPRLRALFEDNKVLKEQARRYKQRLQEVERHAAGLEHQLQAAQASGAKLKAQLHEGVVGQDFEEVAKARQQSEGLAKALEKLQHAHQVLQSKLETDARLHRQALAAAAKERQQVEQQCQELQEQLEAKGKEARAQALAAKQATRKLEEVKAAAAKAVAGVSTQVAEAVAAVEAKHKKDQEARVHLMLCVIHDTSPSAQHQQHVQQDALEVPSQGPGSIWDSTDSSCGPSGRNRSASRSTCSPGGLSREQAVLRLQAGARGYLVRKQQRLQRELQQESFVLLQIGQRQPQEQQDVQAQAPDVGAATAALAGGSEPAAAAAAHHSRDLSFDLTAADSAAWLPATLPPFPAAAAAAGPGATHAPASAVAAAAAAAEPAAGAATGAGAGKGSGGRQRVIAGSSSHATTTTTRKPPLPCFTRTPPASAPHVRLSTRQDSRPPASSTRGTRSGPGTTAGAAAAEAVAAASSSCDGTRGGLKPGAAESSSGSSARVQSGGRPVGVVRAAAAGMSAGQQRQQQGRQRRLSLQPHPPPPALQQQQQQQRPSGSPRRLSSLQTRT